MEHKLDPITGFITNDASTGHKVVTYAENYLTSMGYNNSTGKYDKVVQGVRSILGQSLLEDTKLEYVVEREVDRLLKKYDLIKTIKKVGDKLVPADESFINGLISKLRSEGWSLDSRGKGMMGSVHLQIRYKNKINPKEETEFMKIAKRCGDMINSYAREYEPTWNFGVTPDGYITAGVDIRQKYTKDEKTTDGGANIVLHKKNGYELGVDKHANTIYLAFPGESWTNPHMYLGKFDGTSGKNYIDAKVMFERYADIKGTPKGTVPAVSKSGSRDEKGDAMKLDPITGFVVKDEMFKKGDRFVNKNGAVVEIDWYDKNGNVQYRINKQAQAATEEGLKHMLERNGYTKDEAPEHALDKAIRSADAKNFKLRIYYQKGSNKGNLDKEEFFESKEEMMRKYMQLRNKEDASLNPTAWEMKNGSWSRIAGY